MSSSFRLRASGSGSPATGAWLARRSCAALRARPARSSPSIAAELDLTRQSEVAAWLSSARPDAIVLAAAKVGGILANDTHPADFLYENLMIAANVIEAAHRAGVNRLLFLGSSCIYPKFAPQPIEEDCVADRPARADQRGLCDRQDRRHQALPGLSQAIWRDYISAMPTNLYGPGDNFDLDASHVLPALIRKAHDAKRQRRGGV